MSIITNRQERGRFLRFAVVGVIGAVVDFGTFNLLVTFTPVPAVLAQVISFTAAIFSNFTFNRYWTYPDSRSKRLTGQLAQFALISVIGLAIRTPLFAFLETILDQWFERLALPYFTPVFLGHNLALATSVGVVMLWNFFVNRYWTYNDIKASR